MEEIIKTSVPDGNAYATPCAKVVNITFGGMLCVSMTEFVYEDMGEW